MDKEVQVVSSNHKMRSHRWKNEQIITLCTARAQELRTERRRRRRQRYKPEGQEYEWFPESMSPTRSHRHERSTRSERHERRPRSERHHGQKHHHSERYVKRSRPQHNGSPDTEAGPAVPSDDGVHQEYEYVFFQGQLNENYLRKHSSDISDYVKIMATEAQEVSRRTGVKDQQQYSSDDYGPRRLSYSDSNLKDIEINSYMPKTESRHGRGGEVCGKCTERIRTILQRASKNAEEQEINKHHAEKEQLDKEFSKLYFCDYKSNVYPKIIGYSAEDVPGTESQSYCRRKRCPRHKSKLKSSRKTLKARDSDLESRTSSRSLCFVAEPRTVLTQSSEFLHRRASCGGGSGHQINCSESICPPCGLCLSGCNDLKRSSVEERLYLKREAVRCDCKQQLLKQRLLVAFDVCLKCRMPKDLCHCLEDMLVKYKRNSVPPEVTADDDDCCSCKIGKDDPLEKLLYEVTNTCPKCGRWRKDCICLEEMIMDIKHMMRMNKRSGLLDNACQCVNNASKTVFQEGGCNHENVNVHLPSRRSARVCGPCSSARQRDTAAYSFVMENNESVERSHNATADRPYHATDSNASEEKFERSPNKLFCPQCEKPLSSCKCRVSSSMRLCNNCRLPEILCDCRTSASPLRTEAVYDNRERSQNNREHQQHRVHSEDNKRVCEDCQRPRQKSRETKYPHPAEKPLLQNKPEIHRNLTINASYQTSKVKLDRHITTNSSVLLSVNPKSIAHVKPISTGVKYVDVGQTSRSGEISKKKKQIYNIKDDYNKEPTTYDRELRFDENLCTDNLKCKGNTTNCHQSGFQKLKSHFRRCRTCGKKHVKEKLECRQTQCNYHIMTALNADVNTNDEDRDEKNKKKKSKQIKETKKTDDDKKATDDVDIILSPKRRNSTANLSKYKESVR